MKITKRIALPILAIFVLIASIGAYTNSLAQNETSSSSSVVENKTITTPKPLELKSPVIDTSIKHASVAGNDMWIPRHYKMGSYDSKGLQQQSILLRVLYPDFEPRSAKNLNYFKELGFGRKIMILMSDISQGTNSQFKLDILKKRYPSFEQQQDIYGLEHFVPSNPNEGIGTIREELFIASSKPKQISYIKCEPHVSNPFCVYLQDYLGMQIEVTFSKSYLSEWELIRNSSINLIKGFMSKPIQSQELSDDVSLEKSVHIKIAESEYLIPKRFIDSLSKRDAVEQKSVLLLTNLSNLYRRSIEQESNVSTNLKADFVQIHLQDLNKHPNGMRGIYELIRKEQPSLTKQGNEFNLLFEVPTSPQSASFNYELFTENNATSNLSSFVRCSRKREGKNQTCKHIFEYDGILFSVSYLKENLPEWKVIQQETISFLDGYKID